MKLCIECYMEMWSNSSHMVSIGKQKDKCEKCGKEKYLIVRDYPGMLILDDFVNPFEKNKG